MGTPEAEPLNRQEGSRICAAIEWFGLQGRRIEESWRLTRHQSLRRSASKVMQAWSAVIAIGGSITFVVGYFAIEAFATGVGVAPSDLGFDSTVLVMLGTLSFSIAVAVLSPFGLGLWLSYRLGPWIASLRPAALVSVWVAALATTVVFVRLLLWLSQIDHPGRSLVASLLVLFLMGLAIGVATFGLWRAQKWPARALLSIGVFMTMGVLSSAANGLIDDGRAAAERAHALALSQDSAERRDVLVSYFVQPTAGSVLLASGETLCVVRMSERVFLLMSDGGDEAQSLVTDAVEFRSGTC